MRILKLSFAIGVATFGHMSWARLTEQLVIRGAGMTGHSALRIAAHALFQGYETPTKHVQSLTRPLARLQRQESPSGP